MNQPSARTVRERVSAGEWDLRVNLAACYRLVARYGMTDLVYNHITARVPGDDEHVLINLYGILYKEVTASSLVKIDIDGNVIWKPDTDYGLNVSGYVIHGAIHRARPDVGCIIHTHTRAGMAVSCMREGLLPLTQTSMRFYNHIGYHDYEGPAIDKAEQERLVADLGEHNALVLRNHGLLTCGPSVPEAFNLIYQLEQSCRAQVDVMAAGASMSMPDEETLGLHRQALPARHTPPLRRPRVAGDAASPRSGPRQRLAAVRLVASQSALPTHTYQPM